MTHHLIPELPRDWIGSLTNVLLIRDPAEVVASYTRERTNVVATDIGLVQQDELYDQLGGDVPVIDSADFLQNPEGYLRWLCDHVDVEFTDAMLHWPAGPRDSDGVWAKYWYDAVDRLDRLRAVPAARGVAHRCGARSGRGEPAVLRAPARGARRAYSGDADRRAFEVRRPRRGVARAGPLP